MGFNAVACGMALGLVACSFFDGPILRNSPSDAGEVEEPEPEPEPTAPPRSDEPEPGSSLLLSPRHGQVLGGNTATIPLVIAGRSPSAGQAIEVQLLSNPRDLTTWTTVATTAASDQSDGNIDLGFLWSATISPGTRAADSWPQGGLLRLRVLADGLPAAVLSHDADACIAQNQTEQGPRALACAAKKDNGIVLVSPSEADGLFPDFLARKGIGSLTATQLYYQQTDAPLTYQEFMDRYLDGTNSTRSAVYLNNGDLAVGRNVSCAQFPDRALTGVACMTGNFGAFSGNPGLNLNAAIAGHEAGDALGAFAFVAMVYQPSRGASNTVSFVVYGQDGSRVDTAILDTRGDVDAIPNTCLNCHGSGSTFNEATGIVSKASFLPFDALQLEFPSNLEYTLAAQGESLRALNHLVNLTALNDTTQAVIDDMYPGGVDQPGALMHASNAPIEWSESSRAAETYRNLIAPSCRGCHMTGTIDFSTEDLFRTTGQGSVFSVCGDHSMPNAEVAVSKLWSGPGRAYLVDFFDSADPCAPSAL